MQCTIHIPIVRESVTYEMVEYIVEVFMDDLSISCSLFEIFYYKLEMVLAWCEQINLVLN